MVQWQILNEFHCYIYLFFYYLHQLLCSTNAGTIMEVFADLLRSDILSNLLVLFALPDFQLILVNNVLSKTFV